MPRPDLDIAKGIKTLEWIKADLVETVGRLFKDLVTGSMEAITDNLAMIILDCFLLGKRLGLSFGRLELRVREKTADLLQAGHPLEERYKDLSSLQEYFEMKR